MIFIFTCKREALGSISIKYEFRPHYCKLIVRPNHLFLLVWIMSFVKKNKKIKLLLHALPSPHPAANKDLSRLLLLSTTPVSFRKSIQPHPSKNWTATTCSAIHNQRPQSWRRQSYRRLGIKSLRGSPSHQIEREIFKCVRNTNICSIYHYIYGKTHKNKKIFLLVQLHITYAFAFRFIFWTDEKIYRPTPEVFRTRGVWGGYNCAISTRWATFLNNSAKIAAKKF